eukprot:TRINITY_DN8663_c0_g1_i8.p1 TRINITY_DN8663_c0_g1~~TRINITY_DN8663_c0_g1_i8.p1  ORF type:complete len:338 (+),score=61.57 TRINITY_DN8663_c0_g1_i8:328-1341(+)
MNLVGAQRLGFKPTAVCTGPGFGAALRRDGIVHPWGREKTLGRDGSGTYPAAVDELPRVALLAAGLNGCIAVTTDDEVFGWASDEGPTAIPQLRSGVPRPTRIDALCGRGIRRIACGGLLAAAETSRGVLLVWHSGVDQAAQLGAGRVCFPLRDLVATGSSRFICAADAAGAVWVATPEFAPFDAASIMSGREFTLIAATLPQRQRATRLAARLDGVVVLTATGELFDTEQVDSEGVVWRSISAANPELPLGLVPYGGTGALQVVLAPAHCGGKRRLEILARIAVRLNVPTDPIREILVPFMVHEAHILGPSHDPFSWPNPAAISAPAAAAAAAAQG